jgi:hypothetical protein
VLPVLYTIWRHRQLKESQRSVVPIDVVIGVPRGVRQERRG